MKRARIGTSGFVYPGWRGVFYPRDLKNDAWLSYYARSFDTVEINNSFYHLVAAKDTRHWRQSVPAGFEFAVKGSRYITHMLKLKEAGPALERFEAPLGELEDKLGPLLFQLPPHWDVNPDRLESFLRLFVHRGRQVVLEFRDVHWYCDAVYRLMDKYHTSLCLHDMPEAENKDTVVGPIVYVRRHGAGQRYGGDYPDQELRDLAGRVREWQHYSKHVYVYFNNDMGGHAVKNALTLKAFLE